MEDEYTDLFTLIHQLGLKKIRGFAEAANRSHSQFFSRTLTPAGPQNDSRLPIVATFSFSVNFVRSWTLLG